MAQITRQRRKPQGLVFYTTALVVSLFAVYSILKSSFAPTYHDRILFHARDLVIKDEECRLVHSAPDKCAFVKANCPDEEAGLISYLQLYYCSLQHAQPVAFSILVVWISLLFSTIGIAASDFLCINLSTIATILGMSESLTGVTFLAFGNGSPDVFSTFAAMSSHSGSLAVGELMGAAGFITAVVAGSMAIVKPFRVAKKSFVRDVAFFAVAASFSLVFLADGSLHLWECATMVGFYVFYVIFVVCWHWWQQKTRRRKLAENAARLHLHIPEHQELEVPDIEFDEESQPASEQTLLLRNPSSDTTPSFHDAGTPAWRIDDVDDDDDTRNRYLAELSNNMRVNRHGRKNTISAIRPSLIGALEFRSILSSLERKSTAGRTISLRRYSDDPLASAARGTHSLSQPDLVSDSHYHDEDHLTQTPSGRNRAVSESNALHRPLDQDLLDDANGTPQTAIYSPAPINKHISLSPQQLSPPLLLSPGPITPLSGASSPSSLHAVRNGLLAPPDGYFHRLEQHDNRTRSPNLIGAVSPHTFVPIIKSPEPGKRSPREYRYMDSPRSRTPSIVLPPPILSPESGYHLGFPEDEDTGETRTIQWWPYRYLPTPQALFSTLFPTLYGWRDKSHLDRLLGIVTAPSVFLLTVTLPIVEMKQTEVDADMQTVVVSPEIQAHGTAETAVGAAEARNRSNIHAAGSQGNPHDTLSRRISSYDNKPDAESQESSSHREWNRWLVIVQVFTAPLFVVGIVFANMEEGNEVGFLIQLILGALVVSLVCLFVLLATTKEDQEPKYRPLFCFLGFAVAIAWIATIANEVVGVLKAFGVILDISDAILGLTIFAVGNSLGDLVADITVARLGYPVMALSACFGGPMLNILLGIGIGGMYMTMHNASSRHSKHPDKAVKYRPYQLEVSTTLMISGVTLLVTLLGLLIVVPLNGWRMDRKIGIGLITLWTISTIANVALEVVGIGGEWESIIGR